MAIFDTLLKPGLGELGTRAGSLDAQRRRDRVDANFKAQSLKLSEDRLNFQKQQQEFENFLRLKEDARTDQIQPKQLKLLDARIEQAGQDLLGSKKKLEADTFQLNMARAKIASNVLGKVTSAADLEEANRNLIDTGVIPADKPIPTVGAARMLYEGSEQFRLQQQLQAKAAEKAEDRNFQAAMARAQANQARKLARERADLGLANDVALERVKMRTQQALIREKANAGLFPQTNINIGDAAVKQGQAAGIPGRRDGGPVAPGQPYIVGEEGPELFVPAQGGTVLNQQQVDILGNDEGALDQAAARTGSQAEMLRAQGAQEIPLPDVAPREGTDKPKRSLSDSATIGAAQTALDQIGQLKEFDKQGKLDGTLNQVLQSDQGFFDNIANLARTTDQQKILNLKKNITSIIVKIRSGAQVTDKERAYLSGLLPKTGDTKETVSFKLNQFENEFKNFLYNAKADEIGLPRIKHGSEASSKMNSYVEAFMRKNKDKGATVEDALNWIKHTGRTFE